MYLKHMLEGGAARMLRGVIAEEHASPHPVAHQQQLPLEAAERLSAVGHNNKQSKAPSVGLIRIHSCLSPPQRLRRNSRGLPSATATYTALKKAASGGSLIPGSCQSLDTHSQQQASQSIQHQGVSVQNLRKPTPAATCPFLVSRPAKRLHAV